MLAELEIIPVGTGSTSLSGVLVEVARCIDRSGLEYRVGPMGTVIEGTWDEIMRVARQCHEAVLRSSARAVTTIRLDDRKDKPGSGRIIQKVQSLEQAYGRPLKR